ncbi:O-antigen ligase family protein [Novosphingobium aquimarinum]|uniref:O-antigen ligase family protein n=1 Tax=Novosphingobium aquimarinum TaxID=2682494 RepID=UPI0018DC0182|nr:O-antigen ligase family protein [Novosphingobium aquimarinum]
MSFSSATLDRPAPTARIDLRLVTSAGLIALAAVLVATQFDAIGNTYLGFLPLSVFELLLVALVALGALVVGATTSSTAAEAAHAPGLRLVSALALWMVICLAFSEHLNQGFEYLIRAWAVMLLALLVPLFVRRPEDVFVLLAATAVAGAINAGIVIYETLFSVRLFSTSVAATEASFDGVIRSAGGSDLNPTTVAQMVMVSALAGLVAVVRCDGLARLAGVLIFAVCSLAVVLVSARSAIIGLGVGSAIVLLSFYRSRAFPLLILGGLVALAGGIALMPDATLGRFTALADFASDRSLFRRLTYVQIGWDLIKQHPIWGVGPGNFPSHYMDEAYRYLPGRTLNPRELHNTYLDVIVEYGIVGFALFAALIAAAMHSAVVTAHRATSQPLRTIAFALATCLAALLVASFFMPHKDMRYLWLLVGLALCCRGFLQRERAEP